MIAVSHPALTAKPQTGVYCLQGGLGHSDQSDPIPCTGLGQ